ncbi:hypothetical protein LINPERPRIM_LOCUS36267 [Linum perenne]
MIEDKTFLVEYENLEKFSFLADDMAIKLMDARLIKNQWKRRRNYWLQS